MPDRELCSANQHLLVVPHLKDVQLASTKARAFQLWTQPWGNQPPTQKQYPLQGLQDGVSNRCSAEDVDIH